MDTITLLKRLLDVNTVDSHNGEEVIRIILEYMHEKGGEYTHEIMEFNGMKNLVLYTGEGEAFAMNGHYDVVPVDEEGWNTDPFSPVEKSGLIYARGANDMKGGLAAAVSAFARYSKNPSGRAIMMVVADEEKGGKCSELALERLLKNEKIKGALIPEPSSAERFGDIGRNGCRGVLWLKIRIIGRGGHASKPEKAINPIDALAVLAIQLQLFEFEKANDMVPTTAAVTYAHADGRITNVIPREALARIDVRYNRATRPEDVISAVKMIVEGQGCTAEIEVVENSPYYMNPNREFEECVAAAVRKHCDIDVKFTTGGGSSDARFFAWNGIPALEFGTRRPNMHSDNEAVYIEDVKLLEEILYSVIVAQCKNGK